jgi:hypothetical protein
MIAPEIPNTLKTVNNHPNQDAKTSEESFMLPFEPHLARYLIDLQKEIQTKAEREAELDRLNQNKMAEDFLRNTGGTKTQILNLIKRSAR